MARHLVNRPYRWLALFFDEIFEPFRGPMDEAREHILGRILKRTESACDLACGTGTTALSLARQVIKTYAVDLSPTMCRLAREKARRARLPLHVLRADMREFRLPEPVDLITCESDALNHVPRKSDLGAVARAAARALRAGGYFYFDLNNRRGFETYWTTTFWTEKPGVVLVMRSSHEKGQDSARCEIDWFIREGRLWRRRHERVTEVCWTPQEVRRTLKDAGFDSVRECDPARFFKGDSMVGPGCRTIYLARKKSGDR